MIDFHSSIRIHADGVVEVTERIAVQAEGRELRHGLSRDFRTDHRDRFGNQVTVPLEVQRVTRDGVAESWSLERIANGTRVRIGRADTVVPQGRRIYEIAYRTARQIGHFPDHDELFWSVNGHGWTLPIDHISAEVRLPRAVPAEELRAEGYTGAPGARGRAYRYMVRDGAVGFTSTAAFAPREAMTIVVGFPKNVVHEPGVARRIGWWLALNKAMVGALAIVAVLAIAVWLRSRARAGPARPPPA